MIRNFTPYSQRLRSLARQVPNQPALVMLSQSEQDFFSFAAFDQEVDRFATKMKELGVDDQTAVVLVSPNSAAAVIASSAAWRLGAFVAPIGYQSTIHDLNAFTSQAKTLKPKAYVFSDHVQPSDGTPAYSLSGLRDSDLLEQHDADLSIPARAIPSGGTTGRPKLILDRGPWGYTEGTNTFSIVEADRTNSVLVYSPLYHSVGQTLTHMMMMQGATVYLMDRFDPLRAQRAIRENKIEFFFAVPTHIQRFLELPQLEREAFSSIKVMYHSGAFCPATLKRRWIDFLGPERVWEIYGASEAIGYTRIRGDEWLTRQGSVGRPHNTEIRILSEDKKPVANGDVGIIYMRQPSSSEDLASTAYLGGKLEVADGGFATVGDMGSLDDDGFLYIADRRTDMIISGGVNIFPAQVENALLKVDGVRSAAVVGVADQKWGRRVHAVIVPESVNSPVSIDVILDQLGEILAPMNKPKSFEFRTELPLTPVGKIDRAKLIEEYEQRSNRNEAGEHS